MAVREPLNPIIVVALAPVIVCFWLFVSSRIAEASGWKLMASRYAAERRPDGVRYFWRTMRLGAFVRYKRCINVTLSTAGVYLVPSLLGRFGHMPLLVPWDLVGSLEHRHYVCLLPIRTDRGIWKLSLPGSVADWIQRHVTQRPNQALQPTAGRSDE
jgi:hypothetical protein